MPKNEKKEHEDQYVGYEPGDDQMQHPEDPGKPVIIDAEAYKTIILYAGRYANQNIPRHEWKEIYGVLIGHTDEDFVYVEKAEALTFGHDTDVILDERHYGFIARIDDGLEEINKTIKDKGKKQYQVGWFHSHPGLGLFFSTIDISNQLFFQTHPDGIGLVFDHTQLGRKTEEKIEGTEHTITKFTTGFEIYRVTDPIMDINDPRFDINYHRVTVADIKGLNKFFFANVLMELSALVSAGSPLQDAYGERAHLESSYQDAEELMDSQNNLINPEIDIDTSADKSLLVEIPMNEDMAFDVDDFFYDKPIKKEDKNKQLRESADQLIYEGNQALNNKDAFMGIEKYKKGIEKYKKLGDNERILELLRNISEHCISTNHLVFAEEFSNELFKLATKLVNKFYEGEGHYLKGYLLLKKGDTQILKEALSNIQQATIEYERAQDFAGAGRAYYKIGAIYQSRLNQSFNAALFYLQAIKNYNIALNRSHPLRKALWSKSELLSQRISELKDIIVELIPNIENSDEKKKIQNDLSST
jgi:proteasome lid subunit RPN8/RPN11/tetratricopeptide (TPR) repeat protein